MPNRIRSRMSSRMTLPTAVQVVVPATTLLELFAERCCRGQLRRICGNRYGEQGESPGLLHFWKTVLLAPLPTASPFASRLSLRSSLASVAVLISPGMDRVVGPFQSHPIRFPEQPIWVGLKGAAGYANPDDGSPSVSRRTSIDERNESIGTSTGPTEVREARSESRERNRLGLSCCFRSYTDGCKSFPYFADTGVGDTGKQLQPPV
jgi:hypothetical protein